MSSRRNNIIVTNNNLTNNNLSKARNMVNKMSHRSTLTDEQFNSRIRKIAKSIAKARIGREQNNTRNKEFRRKALIMEKNRISKNIEMIQNELENLENHKQKLQIELQEAQQRLHNLN